MNKQPQPGLFIGIDWADQVEPTDASKLRRTRAAFVHEVEMTDAPERNG